MARWFPRLILNNGMNMKSIDIKSFIIGILGTALVFFLIGFFIGKGLWKPFFMQTNIPERRITIVCKGEPQNKDFKLTKHGDMLINGENCRNHYPPFLNNNNKRPSKKNKIRARIKETFRKIAARWAARKILRDFRGRSPW